MGAIISIFIDAYLVANDGRTGHTPIGLQVYKLYTLAVPTYSVTTVTVKGEVGAEVERRCSGGGGGGPAGVTATKGDNKGRRGGGGGDAEGGGRERRQGVGRSCGRGAEKKHNVDGRHGRGEAQVGGTDQRRSLMTVRHGAAGWGMRAGHVCKPRQ